MYCPRALSLAVLAALLFIPSFSIRAEDKPNDAVVPAPREGGWMTRHNSFNGRVKKGNVDLVFIGDSITQGWEGKGKDVWAEFYGKRNAVNLGIGGDRTQHVLWRLDNGNLEGVTPKAAVIMIGTSRSLAPETSNTHRQLTGSSPVFVRR